MSPCTSPSPNSLSPLGWLPLPPGPNQTKTRTPARTVPTCPQYSLCTHQFQRRQQQCAAEFHSKHNRHSSSDGLGCTHRLCHTAPLCIYAHFFVFLLFCARAFRLLLVTPPRASGRSSWSFFSSSRPQRRTKSAEGTVLLKVRSASPAASSRKPKN